MQQDVSIWIDGKVVSIWTNLERKMDEDVNCLRMGKTTSHDSMLKAAEDFIYSFPTIMECYHSYLVGKMEASVSSLHIRV